MSGKGIHALEGGAGDVLGAEPGPASCILCDALQQSAHAHPGQRFDCLCGAVWIHDGPRVRCVRAVREFRAPVVKLARPRAPTSPPTDAWKRVIEYVKDVIRWDRQISRIESAVRGERSSLAGAIEALQLGILGTGNSGTKGVGVKPASQAAHDAEAVIEVDPVASARYRALRGDALRVTDAIIADGAGDQLVDLPFGRKKASGENKLIGFTLWQRIAWRVADERIVRGWNQKLIEGDSTPALVAAEELGLEVVPPAAEEWWAAVSSG